MNLLSPSHEQRSLLSLLVLFIFSIVMTLFMLRKADQAIAEINTLIEYEVYLGK